MGALVDELYKGRTTLSSTTEDKTFAILQALFPDIQLVDKYMQATMTFYFNETCKEIFKKKGFPDRRLSDKESKRIREGVLEKLRVRYGKWINFTNFKWSRSGGFKFDTNFNSTYRTSKGILYGHSPNSYLREVFYTAHALQRFDERLPTRLRNEIDRDFKTCFKYIPTAADILDFMIIKCLDYGVDAGDYRYVNAEVGVLVVETFRDVHIVKTFLTPDMMVDKNPSWFEVVPNEFEIEHCGGRMQVANLTELFQHRAIQSTPTFLRLSNYL